MIKGSFFTQSVCKSVSVFSHVPLKISESNYTYISSDIDTLNICTDIV